MKTQAATLVWIALGALLASCASQPVTEQQAFDQGPRQQAQAELSKPVTQSNDASMVGLTMMGLGHNWTAANLLERAVQDRATPLDQFNLACAYQATGRLVDALQLYQTVAVNGRWSYGTSVHHFADRNRREVRFNLADEATRRVKLIQLELAASAAGQTPADLAAEKVHAYPATARVSDEQALELDAIAPTAPTQAPSTPPSVDSKPAPDGRN